MRHLFIINPAAGQGEAMHLVEQIHEAMQRLKVNGEFYYTKGRGDGEAFVRKIAEEGKPVRFYSCGGDGTLNEVVNGAYGYSNAEVGCIPKGTGNDFVRNFSGEFTDIEAQLQGTSTPCDLIQYTMGGTRRCCINMFNIGFDCNVVDLTTRLKKKPFIGGSLAYLLGVAITLIKKKGADLQIFLEEEKLPEEKILLIAVANGCFCGGGVKGVPKASTNDGLMDVSVVRNISRTQFLQLFPRYAKGTHLEHKKIDKIVAYKKCKSLRIVPNGQTMRLAIDGEIVDGGTVEFTMIPGGIKFV
ncbi:MAG: YegS/Rv2252/BmrU family lipid kinase, partial [Anaerovoracaceae bacterium]